MIDSPTTTASETPAQASQPPNVLKCPVLSGPTDLPKETNASPDTQTTCEETPSSPDQTSAAPHPDPIPEPFDILYELTPRQRQTIDLLLAGLPMVQIAKTLGITPRTITRWKTCQPEFIAEYNRRIADHSTVTAARLRRMVDLALTQVETVMASNDTKLKTTSSLRILSTMVSRNLAHQHGPTQCADVIASFLKDRLLSYNEDDKTPLTGDLREPFTFELTQYLIDEEQRELKEQQAVPATDASTGSVPLQPDLQQSEVPVTPQAPPSATPSDLKSPIPPSPTAPATPTPDSSTTASEPNVAAASRRRVLASCVESLTLASQPPATPLPPSPVSAFCIQHSEFPPNVLKCPVLSGPTDLPGETNASPDIHTTCEQPPSCPDQTSAASEPPAVPQQDQTPQSDTHSLPPVDMAPMPTSRERPALPICKTQEVLQKCET